jgi:hypothetical protein
VLFAFAFCSMKGKEKKRALNVMKLCVRAALYLFKVIDWFLRLAAAEETTTCSCCPLFERLPMTNRRKALKA